jgi:putative transcriptional regulator
MSKQYRSDAMASIHETMEALHKVGAIDKQTMRRFDDACLNPRGAADAETDEGSPGAGACEPDGVRELPQRDAEPHQQVGAGEKKPSGPALKLLSLVEKHGITAVA